MGSCAGYVESFAKSSLFCVFIFWVIFIFILGINDHLSICGFVVDSGLFGYWMIMDIVFNWTASVTGNFFLFFIFLLLGHFYFIWGLNLRFDDFLCWLYLNLLGMSKTGYRILVLGFLGRTYDLVHAMQLYVHGMVDLRNWVGFNVTQAISFILSWPSYLNAFRNLVWNCSLNYI